MEKLTITFKIDLEGDSTVFEFVTSSEIGTEYICELLTKAMHGMGYNPEKEICFVSAGEDNT